MRSCPNRIALRYSAIRLDVFVEVFAVIAGEKHLASPPSGGRIARVAHNPVNSPMDSNGSDWLIDAPIPCPTCGKEAVAKIAVLKGRDAIYCSYCGTEIDLTDPGCRAFIEEVSDVVASLFSVSEDEKAADKR